jgi:SAM-dependent methyltransferase
LPAMSDNTKESFRNKWFNNKESFFNETLANGSEIQNWIVNRNGFSTRDQFSEHLSKFQRILDAGCGNGRVTALLRSLTPEKVEVVGIDLVAADVASANLKGQPNLSFKTVDLIEDLTSLGIFDYIYCQEVLHHTKDPKLAFSNLCKILADDGEIAIYVYKKKSPLREYCDDYIRGKIAHLNYPSAMETCKEMALLGKALSDLNVEITVPEVKVLEIPAGQYSIQRFIYHFFAKCFWNNSLSEHENIVVNYDWYHPQTSSRHTVEEVEGWFVENELEIINSHVDFYGITVRGKKYLRNCKI